MDHDPSDESAPRRRPLLRAADQGTVAFLIGSCFLAILTHCGWHAVIRQQRIDFDRAPPLELEFRIDVNTADWAEFTLLPGIGQTLAERIVAHRGQHGPFRTVDELANVKGIGPKTLRRIRPFLKAAAGQDGSHIEQRTADLERRT